jgi:predicted permease
MLTRMASFLVRLLLPRGETGDAISADLDRETRALAARRSLWLAESWRVLQAIQISLHFLPRRLRGTSGSGDSLRGVLGDLRYAIRRLGRAPLATGVSIVVAGLGIGAATATFSVLQAVLLRPLPYPEPHELVQLSESVPDQAGMAFGRGFVDSEVSPLNYLDYAEAASFANAAWIAGYTEDVDGLASIGPVDGAVEFAGVMSVAPSFFATMGARMALGSTFADDESFRLRIIDDYFMGRVVLSHDLWTRRFASDPAIVGKTVVFEGGRVEVAGILAEGFEFPPLSERGRAVERDVDVYISQSSWPLTFPRDRGVLRAVARLRSGVAVEVAQEELDRIAARLRETHPEIDDGMRVVIAPLHDHFARDYGRAFYTLFGMVALVLLVACANLAGLAVAQGLGRDAEMSVRSALGGGRGRLLRLVLVESLVVSLCGGVLGVVLAYTGTEALIELLPTDVARGSTVGLDANVLAFALLASVVVGVGFGLLPAIQCSGNDMFRALGGRGMTRARRMASRRLVGVQLSLTLVLLAGAALLGKSYARLRGSELGFESQGVLQLSINRGFLDEGFAIGWWDLENRRDRWLATTEIVEGIRAVPAVSSVATGDVNIARTQVWRVRVEHGDSTRPIDAFVENVSPEYFAVLGIPIVRGRGLVVGDKDVVHTRASSRLRGVWLPRAR